MKIARPLIETLSVTQDGITTEKTIYQPPKTITGVDDGDYSNYDDSATYNTGDYVLVPELKTIYRCTADNISGKFPPNYPDIWVDWGFINSYKMLSNDTEIGSQTIGNNIFIEYDFNQLDTIGFVNINFAEMILEEIDNNDSQIINENVATGDGETKEFYLANNLIAQNSETIYKNGTALTRDTDYTIDYFEGKIIFNTTPSDGDSITADYTKCVIKEKILGRDIGCLSFAEYFYDEIREKTRVIITDLKWLPSATLRMYFQGEVLDDGTTSDVKIGSLVLGRLEELGITLMGTSMSFEDKSKIANDEFTNTRKVIRYGHIRVLKARIMFNVPDYNVVAIKINDIIGKNVLFVPDESDKFYEMSNIAYIESFEMPLENPVLFQANTTIIGVT